jgi:hypothetical protein
MIRNWCVPFNSNPSSIYWTLPMAYSKEKLKSNGYTVSACIKSSWIANIFFCVTFHNMLVFRVRNIYPPALTPSWRTSLVGCPRLLIQYTGYCLYTRFSISAVLFQYHKEHQYPIRGHGRSCRAGPLSCARSFTDSPHHFDSGDYKLRPLMVYRSENTREFTFPVLRGFS